MWLFRLRAAQRKCSSAVRAAPASPKPERFDGLNGARLLASVHIVLGHLYQSGRVAGLYFLAWGFTWVPWFFMLSGFVLALSKLREGSPNFENFSSFLRKRTAAIYPLYATGLVLALGVRWGLQGLHGPRWYELFFQGLLGQSLLPWLPENTVQIHCWFLSALLPFWCLFTPVMRGGVLKLRTVGSAAAALLLLAAPPWLAVLLPSALEGVDPLWYKAHHTGRSSTAVDLLVITLKFHPLSYLHVFTFGMVLAQLRALVGHALREAHPSPLARALAPILRHGASMGYLGLLLVFTVPEVRPTSYKLSARLSVLMLPQGLILLGLAPLSEPEPAHTSSSCTAEGGARRGAHDPLTRLFARAPHAWGNVSYSQYVLQFVAMQLWPVERLGLLGVLEFFVFLLSWGYLSATLLVNPASALWHNQSPRRLLMIAVTVSVALASACGLREALRHRANACGIPETPPPLPPPYVTVEAGAAVDVRLNWTAGDGSEGLVLINPSLLWSGASFVRAARLHGLSCVEREVEWEGVAATELTTRWESQIATAVEPLGGVGSPLPGWDPSRWQLGTEALWRREIGALRDGNLSAWWPMCQTDARYHPRNNTVLRKEVSGPEDPKLVLTHKCAHMHEGTCSSTPASAVGLVFSSYPPKAVDPLCGTGYTFGEGRTGHTVYQMFLSLPSGDGMASGLDGPSEAPGVMPAVRLECGLGWRPQKNWIHFSVPDDSRPHFVHTVAPQHRVVTVAADGSCENDEWLTEDYPPFLALAAAPGVRVSGSATAVRWNRQQGASVADEFLALLHTKDAQGRYTTMAYTFSARPPFSVSAVSRPLPLSGEGRAFASGLAIPPASGKVLVSYGVADAEARALVMSDAYLRRLFDWCTEDQVLTRAARTESAAPGGEEAAAAGTTLEGGSWVTLLLVSGALGLFCTCSHGVPCALRQQPGTVLR